MTVDRAIGRNQQREENQPNTAWSRSAREAQLRPGTVMMPPRPGRTAGTINDLVLPAVKKTPNDNS